MPVLIRDYETKSALDLTKVGAWKYSTHASTDVWCCNYAVDGDEIKLWLPGDPVPAEFIEAAQNPEWIAAAFNDQFERLIESTLWPRAMAGRRFRSSGSAAYRLPRWRWRFRLSSTRWPRRCISISRRMRPGTG